jgi:hypothetical protein
VLPTKIAIPVTLGVAVARRQPLKSRLMETLDAGGPRPLLIIGGVLALDFANTVDDPGSPAGFDYLGDAIRTAACAANRGLRAPPSE